MGFDAFWQQFLLGCYQVWLWLRYVMEVHPFLILGTVVVVISAWALYKMEVRSR